MTDPYLINGLFSDLMSSDKADARRVKTESQTLSEVAYEEGRKFRAFYDFTGVSIPVVLRFEVTKNLDLSASIQEVHDGSMRYRVYLGGVEGGTFTPVATIPTNNKAGAPTVDSGVSLSVGGTLDTTGVLPSDIVYVRTSGASGQTSTVTDSALSMRGFPPVIAYVVIDQIPSGNKTPSGVARYEWTVSK